MNFTFEIQPVKRFSGASASIKRPKEIACFSYDDRHKFHLDASSIKYYYPPPLDVDLCKGFDQFQKHDGSTDGHIDSLLKTLIDHEQKTGLKAEAHIITWRGMMTKLMGAIFNDRDGFEMNATFFQGTIFIEENHAYALQSQARQFGQASAPGRPSQEMMTYWGYKFESLCLLPQTWMETSRDEIEGREDAIVNNNAQYCSVVTTGIGNTSIILGGEVDGIWDSKPLDTTEPINWVELKTNVQISNNRDAINYERKLMKIWIQSFLLGVPKVIVGFRTRDGVLKQVEELDTLSIPNQVKKQGRNIWDGNMCINFASKLLEFLCATIKGDGVWRIRRKEYSPSIDLFRVEEIGHGEILSDEFVQWRLIGLRRMKESVEK
ncbi:Decapping nuclease [Podosphaera aphanis]|nr:Decapping nuclease [Podosphaera aphanis]